MSYFCTPYQVLFHDTMAYGSHHHTTNIKFQNIARERLLFESKYKDETWHDQLKDIVMLTREAYSINFAPVQIGEKVVIFLTYEAPSRSTVRLCFRVLKSDGTPVSCGYQTIVLIDKDTMTLVPAPGILTQFLDPAKKNSLLEGLQHPNFKTRVHKKGITTAVFSEKIMEMAKHIGSLPLGQSYPKIIDENLNEYPLFTKDNAPSTANKVVCDTSLINGAASDIVFTFPGQGANKYPILKEIYENSSDKSVFEKADELCQQYFGTAFLPLVKAETEAAYKTILKQHPDLNQIDIFLTNTLLGENLMKAGVQPTVLLGHSFGEFAALTIGGVFSIETGLEIVCERISALQTLKQKGIAGKMAAVGCSKKRLKKLLKSEEDNIEITVTNHPKQTVVSGTLTDLENLRDTLAQKGISTTILNSSYPFHSSHLQDAVALFQKKLEHFEFAESNIPVYLNIQQMYHSDLNMPELLAAQFVTPLNFETIANNLFYQGYRQFVECGVRGIVRKILDKNFKDKDATIISLGLDDTNYNLENQTKNIAKKLGVSMPLPSNKPTTKTIETPKEACTEMPIAIVSLGAVLPGSKNPEAYWNAIKDGIEGIVDLAKERPEIGKDFMAGTQENVIADKTYTLLNGTILNIEYEADLLKNYYSETEFNALTRGEKLMALALAQSVQQFSVNHLRDKKIQCIIGATADGMEEYDSALFLESIYQYVENLEADEAAKSAFNQFLANTFDYNIGDIEGKKQLQIFKKVASKILKKGAKTYIIDSACSSSLYAIHTGIRSLQTYDADVVYAGGVFAPGPANNTLFAQFRGLTPDGIRPMDSNANGVIFSDGAAFVVLKRLSDAMANDDHILGVIRGIGLSSDGKSPSINVPKVKGQVLAIDRAYEHSRIEKNTIQYVEAHATSTPVGDAVEFKSLSQAFSENQEENSPKIQLASVKALIGHTGWVSGAASVIKICKAFENKAIPKQYNFSKPNKNVPLADSPFEVADSNLEWQENRDGLPRRAGINSFGFGGTNAHLILEEYKAEYHTNLCFKNLRNERNIEDFVVVGISSLFPSSNGKLADSNFENNAIFNRKKLHLPPKKLLLPDVTDHMDISQFLATLSAHNIFSTWPKEADSLNKNVGIVLGIEDKTERGKSVLDRIFLDHLNRKINERLAETSNENEQIPQVLKQLTTLIKDQKIPSGPYTLPGLMPNVSASRIAHIFNLNGPNIAVDAGKNSLFQALSIAKDFLMNDACKIVLAGGVNADKTNNEGMLLMAIASQETAEKYNLPVLAKLNITEIPKSSFNGEWMPTKENQFNGAQGCLDIIKVMKSVQQEGKKIALRDFSRDNALRLLFYPANEKLPKTKAVEEPKNAPQKELVKNKKTELKSSNYVQNTPIEIYTPTIIKSFLSEEEKDWKNEKILFLSDQPKLWEKLEKQDALEGLHYTVAFSEFAGIKNAKRITPNQLESLKGLKEQGFSAIIALKNLEKTEADSILNKKWGEESTLLNMLFMVSKFYYEEIKSGTISLNTLTFNAVNGGVLRPYSGLFAGFMKSMNRELPKSNCSILHTDAADFKQAMKQLATENAQTTDKQEVIYLNKERHVFQLEKVTQLAKNETPILNKNSVIIATGGGRGVTAVLLENLLKKHECTIIAVGRTSLADVPDHILNKSEAEFKAFQGQFYKEELAKKDGRTIVDLKREYAHLQACNELHRTISEYQKLGGKFDYLPTDITKAKAVKKLVKYTIDNYGKVDMIIHGAGVQVSKALPKKSLETFEKIVSVKLQSLIYLYQNCQYLQPNQTVHYHLLTSAFSYLGNDGQPDYGAANETMNRIAAAMNNQTNTGNWSTIAWLGWAGIGMTRGSEYAALAASRNLRGITKLEGQKIFGQLMNGSPARAINILLAEGEKAHYQPNISAKKASPKLSDTFTKSYHINLQNTPFLVHHQTNEVPTLPGAFILCLMAETAQNLRPTLKITGFRDFDFKKFIKVFNEKGMDIRVLASMESKTKKGTLIKIQVLSDFVHKSGKILQKDIVHTEGFVLMNEQVTVAKKSNFTQKLTDSIIADDPYLLPGSPVQLEGYFKTLTNIELSKNTRIADFQLGNYDFPKGDHDHLIAKMTMMDALWRFGAIEKNEDDSYHVFVPSACKEMNVFFDFSEKTEGSKFQKLQFRGANPVLEKDNLLAIGPLEILNEKGEVVLTLENGLCREFGKVEAEKVSELY